MRLSSAPKGDFAGLFVRALPQSLLYLRRRIVVCTVLEFLGLRLDVSLR